MDFAKSERGDQFVGVFQKKGSSGYFHQIPYRFRTMSHTIRMQA